MVSVWERLKRRLPWSAPRFIERLYPDVLWYGDARLPHVALSYDDGPDIEDTPRILDVLARHEVRASFALIGERAAAHPGLVSEIAGAGHHVMLHGHRSFLLDHPGQVRKSLTVTRSQVLAAAGHGLSNVSHVRPPLGHITPRLARRLRQWGYLPVMGSVVPPHWLQPPRFTIAQVERHLQNGALIVLHESLGGASIAALTDEILTRIQGRGLMPITVEQMWDERRSCQGLGNLALQGAEMSS
jgi:peptidoglycan/xylan/chitin deacetylase (PgdA/CDA1 family)